MGTRFRVSIKNQLNVFLTDIIYFQSVKSIFKAVFVYKAISFLVEAKFENFENVEVFSFS